MKENVLVGVNEEVDTEGMTADEIAAVESMRGKLASEPVSEAQFNVFARVTGLTAKGASRVWRALDVTEENPLTGNKMFVGLVNMFSQPELIAMANYFGARGL